MILVTTRLAELLIVVFPPLSVATGLVDPGLVNCQMWVLAGLLLTLLAGIRWAAKAAAAATRARPSQ